MADGIGEVLTLAVAVAVSPIPIIAVILMLFTARAKANSLAFLVGWVIALSSVAVVVYVLATAGDVGDPGGASDAVSWGKLVLGAALLVMAGRQWRKRPEPGAEPEMPHWMTGIDALTPSRALTLGVLLGVNPKNLLLTAAAAAGLAQLDLTDGAVSVALLVFVGVASLSIAGLVLYARLGGEAARLRLEDVRAWMGFHSAAIMTVILLVIGVDLIAKAIPPLA